MLYQRKNYRGDRSQSDYHAADNGRRLAFYIIYYYDRALCEKKREAVPRLLKQF